MALNITPRQSLVLAALAAGRSADLAPVQVQKLFFLLDENIAPLMGGRQFSFRPYNYGPFDPSVYHDLEKLQHLGLVHIVPGAGGARRYSATAEGERQGLAHLDALPETARSYIVRVSQWVRSMSFAELVGAIYRAYPAMKQNSIFVPE